MSDVGAGGSAGVRARAAWSISDAWVTATLLVVAGAAWAATVALMRGMGAAGMSGGAMSSMGAMTPAALSLPTFLTAWVAMMAAMMLPAISPVVRLYARAAGRGLAAPLPVFVAGYLIVWSAVGLPAFVAWRALSGPVAGGEAWAGRVAGAVLLVAAVYQLTPLKTACLRHCRSPMGFFMRLHGDLRSSRTALSAGLAHGLICLGCCWALMAVLVALGTMSIPLMLVVAGLVFAEKNLGATAWIVSASTLVLGALGVAVIAAPALAAHLS